MLGAAADMIEEAAEVTGFAHIVVARESDDDEVRAFAIAIAKKFAFYFATPCYMHTARFTAVALNLEIEIETLRTRVRDWWAAYQPHWEKDEHLARLWEERKLEAADGDED